MFKPERIHPHPKSWKPNGFGSTSGVYRIRPKKRVGVVLLCFEVVIFEAPTAKIAKMFAARHAAGEIGADRVGEN